MVRPLQERGCSRGAQEGWMGWGGELMLRGGPPPWEPSLSGDTAITPGGSWVGATPTLHLTALPIPR